MSSTNASGQLVAASDPNGRSIDLLVKDVNRRELDFLVRYVVDSTYIPGGRKPWVAVIAYEPRNARELVLERLGWLSADRHVKASLSASGKSPEEVLGIFRLYYGFYLLKPSDGKVELLGE